MAKTLYKYEASSNKFVWFTTWDRALRNYYTDDYDYVPDPVVSNPFNTYVEFISRKPLCYRYILDKIFGQKNKSFKTAHPD